MGIYVTIFRRSKMEQDNIRRISNSLFNILPVMSKKVFKAGDRVLKGTGISGPHAHLMNVLNISGPCMMSDLGKKLSVSKSNITMLVEKLVDLDFVKRIYDDKDRRSITVALTDKGRLFLKELMNSIESSFYERLKVLSDEDLALLKNSLSSIESLLKKIEDD